MSTPKPQTIDVEISEELRMLALSAGSHAAVKQQAAKILKACDDLQKRDVITASLLKSNLYALLGDTDSSEYWTTNATRNGGKGVAINARAGNLYLLGKISESLSIFEEAFNNRTGAVAPYLTRALSVGWFKKAQWVIGKAEQTAFPAHLQKLANDGASMMDELNLSEEATSRIMDEAHGIMIARRLIWLDEVPEIQFVGAGFGGPTICISYRIETSPDEAAELSWDLATKLAERGLDSKGVLVSFQGAMLNGDASKTDVASAVLA